MSEYEEIAARVRGLLENGRAGEAARAARPYAAGSVALADLYGLALLRSGQAAAAVDHYRAVCINASGVCLRSDLPVEVHLHYALALAANRNVAGTQRVVQELEPGHPGVVHLRSAIHAWRRRLTLWQRLMFDLYGEEPPLPFPIENVPDGPPETRRPAA